MFKKLTQSIVNQLDPKGDLVPVGSIFDHEHFRPLCLVRRKRRAVFHLSPCYKQTQYRLADVLLPGEGDKSTESLLPSPGGEASRQFTVTQSVTDRIDGNLGLHVEPTRIELKGVTSLAKEWTIKMEKRPVPVAKLEVLKGERKINVNHPFIQQLQKTHQNLYVIHETIEASEETSYKESTQAEGSFMSQLYAKFCMKGSRVNNQSITIPKGCTLAFRAIPLAIKNGSWDLQYFPEMAKRSCFVSDGISQGKLGELEAEVKKNCQILSKLPSDLSIIFLEAIKVVMRDRNLFQELSQKVEAVLDESGCCELKTDSPGLKDLLSSLERSPRIHLLSWAEAISYTLDALDELTEDQLLLLMESLEEKIVPKQLKLVKSILEQDQYRKGPFSIDHSLVSFTQEKEEKLTIAMVEMSGVKLQKDESATCVEAFPAVAALYVSLYVLNLLSNQD
ncbi:gasdermin-A [Apus apus]|uniref:gasdermin-A n=1 Tax=Apus apus TaxID=8895 RepID=UPI0021F8255A|nr:gasdermin-A [Apus apus]